MAWGDGSIIHKGGDAWELQVPLGRGLDGSYRRHTETVHGKRSDALRRRRALVRARDLGDAREGGAAMFADTARAWAARLRERGEHSEAATVQGERIARILAEEFGGLRLDEITPARIDDGLTKLQRSRDVGGTTLHRYYTVLNRILQTAADYGRIAGNPCKRVKPPTCDDVERRALDAEAARRLDSALERAGRRARAIRDDEQAAMFAAARLALATGARLGELLAATRGDIAGEPPQLRIDKALADSGDVKRPKTKAGVRLVPIPPRVARALAGWMGYQERRARETGQEIGNGSRLFPCSGKCSFSKRWRRWADSNGFPGLKFHELRHTYATLLLGAGVDVKTVQRLLGHASATITLDHYAHAIPANMDAAADTLGEILSGGFPSK